MTTQGPPRRRKRKKVRKKPHPKMLDLHFRVGFEDNVVRISPADFQKLVIYWMCGREDVVLRGAYQNMETDYILRGTSDGRIAVKEADPKTKMARFQVIRLFEVRAEMLEKQGL